MPGCKNYTGGANLSRCQDCDDDRRRVRTGAMRKQAEESKKAIKEEENRALRGSQPGQKSGG